MIHRPTLLAASIVVVTGLAAQTGELVFDGVDDRILVPNNALNAIGSGPFTVEAWVHGEEGAPYDHIRLVSNRTSIGVGFIFGFHGLWGGSNYKMLMVQMNDFNYIRVNNGTYNGSLLDGTCHHVAISRDVDSVRFYADGVQFGNFHPFPEHTAASSAENMIIGDDVPDPYPFAGGLSHLRLWNYARTGAQITAAMDLAISGATPGLLGDWQMTEGSGQVAADQTFTAHGQLGTTMGNDSSDPTWSPTGCMQGGVGIHESEPEMPVVHADPDGITLNLTFRAAADDKLLQLIDATGRSVVQAHHPHGYQARLDVSSLRAGVYTLVIRGEDATQALRWVKP